MNARKDLSVFSVAITKYSNLCFKEKKWICFLDVEAATPRHSSLGWAPTQPRNRRGTSHVQAREALQQDKKAESRGRLVRLPQ